MQFILLRLLNVFLNQYAKYRLLKVRMKIFNAALLKGKIWRISTAHMIRQHMRWMRPYLLILALVLGAWDRAESHFMLEVVCNYRS
jgi:hypothetical protein